MENQAGLSDYRDSGEPQGLDRARGVVTSVTSRGAWPPAPGFRRKVPLATPKKRRWVRLCQGLTDLEKPTQHTARSNTPRPSTCKVERETESQMRTWGGRGCRKERTLPSAQLLSCPLFCWPPLLHHLSLLCGAGHLPRGDGDHIRVDSQAEETGDRWTGLSGRGRAPRDPGPLLL